MEAPPHVVFALLGDPTGSSRALRQLRALGEAGIRVEAIGFGTARHHDAVSAPVRLRMLPLPAGRGPALFWAAHRALGRALRTTPGRVYLASDLYTLPALAAAARSTRGRLVYDSRELYAALDSSAGRPLVAAGWRAVERTHIRRADAVLTVSDGIADHLATAYGIARPVVLPNVSALSAPPPRTDALQRALGLPDDGRLLVLYQGLLRAGRGLPALLDAAGKTDGVRVVLIGEGDLEPDLRRRAAPLGTRAAFLPFTPPDALPPLTACADLGACLIEPRTESLRLSLPNKLFEYLSAGVPVLASPLPEILRVVERFDVGPLASPTDPTAVAEALRHALDPARLRAWRARTRGAAAAHAWPPHADRFVRLIHDLISSPP